MKKLLFFMLVAILALLPTGALLAQDSDAPQVHCGDLAEEDCELLVRSRETMQGLTSGVSLFTFDADLSSIPLLPIDDGSAKYRQETRFAIEPEALEQIAAIKEMDADELASLMGDAQAYTDFMTGLALSTDLDQTISVDLSDELDDYLSGSLGINLPAELSLQYILVNGILYLRMSRLSELAPALEFMGEWVGIDLPTAMTLFSEDGLLTVPEDLEPIKASLIPPGIAYTGMGLLDEDQQSAMFDAHTQIIRVRDDEIDGEPVATYASRLDFVGLLTDPDVQMWLIDLFGEELMSTLGITKENRGAMPALLAIAGPAFFNELEYTILQSVGIEDAYLYRNEVDLSWDLNRIATMVGTETTGSPILFAVTSTTENSDFDNTVVEAPYGATVLPLSLIMQLVGEMQQ